MKPSMTEYTQYVLYNVENYRSTIQNTPQEILAKFVEVIIEYMRLMAEKINIKNKQYYVFIFERGIEILIHVFSMIFYYTKNLELTFYHSQKAYYFFVEFIEQISDDNITFLQLSSRDALMFVYKKTIFELNNEYKKCCPLLSSNELEIVSYMDAHMRIYKKLVSFIIFYKDFKVENKSDYINVCCDKIHQFSSVINTKFKPNSKSKGDSFNKEDIICLFINWLENEQTSLTNIEAFFDILNKFIERLKKDKKLTNKKSIINKIYNINNHINETQNDFKLTNIIEYVFT